MPMTIEIEVQDCETLTLEIIDAPFSSGVSIDDAAGIGDTDVTWSADKSASELADKVDKVEGHSLVADDEIGKLSTVEQYAQKNTVSSVAGKQGDVLLDKDDVGLSAVDNTADADKPVSTAVADALAGKVDAESGMGLSELSFTTVDKLSLDQSEQDRHTHNNKPVIDDLSDDAGVLQYKGLPISDQAALDAKVDKVAGYSLVDDAEIAKLATVQENATANRDDSENADKLHTHQASDITDLDTAIESKIVGELGQSETVAVSQKTVTDALLALTPLVNDIGVAGAIGFGVGVCPLSYGGMSEMQGTRLAGHDNYGNYQYKDGSVMAWVPAYFYRYNHADNPTYATYGVNSIHVLPRHAYPTVLAAAVAGYALHRAFYDDGVEQPGFFHDKYLCSNNDGIASSIKNGKAITSSAAHYPFNGLTGSPSNNLSGAIAAAKTRGDDYFPSASFLFDALAKLSLAHAQASTSSAACAWYDSTGVSNFPKGCNNNALGDAQDSSIEYESTGHETYDKAGKTGSGMPFAKTTHNGQACGIADLNGLLWEIVIGVTILDGSYYILNKEARMADLTAGVTLDTDAWGAAGLAKNYTELGPAFGALGTKSDRAIGSASQVFSSETEGLEWEAACSGIPLADGMGGTNLFGNDRLYDTTMPEHMCIAAGGIWGNSVLAGVWARSCSFSRAISSYIFGFRSALYLVKRSDSE